MRTAGEDIGKGGSGEENGGEVLCGGGASGASIWVRDVGTDPQFKKSLGGFHHQAIRRMAGMVPKRQRYGTWVYTPIEAALEMVVMEGTRVYIT